MKRHWILLAILALSGCGDAQKAPSQAEAAAPEAGRSASKTGLQVTPDLQRQWGVRVGQAVRTTATGAITLLACFDSTNSMPRRSPRCLMDRSSRWTRILAPQFGRVKCWLPSTRQRCHRPNGVPGGWRTARACPPRVPSGPRRCSSRKRSIRKRRCGARPSSTMR